MVKKLSKVELHERWLWGAAVILLALLLLWFMAAYYKWGPFKPGTTTPVTTDSATGSTSGGSSGSSGGGANGGNGSNGSNGTSGVSPAAGTGLFNLYGSVSSGEAKTDVQTQASNISPSCLVSTAQLGGGKQEVCVYTQGDRLVTITYLNNRVVSISKSGF